MTIKIDKKQKCYNITQKNIDKLERIQTIEQKNASELINKMIERYKVKYN